MLANVKRLVREPAYNAFFKFRMLKFKTGVHELVSTKRETHCIVGFLGVMVLGVRLLYSALASFGFIARQDRIENSEF